MRVPSLLSGLVLLAFFSARGENWPAWRGGPEFSGTTSETNLPLHWSATENVRWKVSLPERGNSTPIVWGDRVFVTQAVADQRLLLCFDRHDGHELWRGGAAWTETEPSHPTNPYCSGSPATDGERVVAWFGSAGLYCFDLQGKELWHRDLGKQEHQWGYGTSPVLYGKLCYLSFGPGARSFLVAMDKETGREVWRVNFPREDGPKDRTDGYAGKDGEVGTWSNPVIAHTADGDELLLSVPGSLRSYDPATGQERWRCDGLTPLIYTSPLFSEGIAVAMSGFGGSDLAVKLGGAGNITDSRIWMHPRAKQRIGSGVIYEGRIYILNTPGIAQCIDLKSGETLWSERLAGSNGRSDSWSSMVRSGDLLYVLNQAGDTFVVRAAPKFEQVAMNSISDGLTNASLAVSNGELFIRTHQHLWCIGGK
jgi:outer membrane protein assembly factor BamB